MYYKCFNANITVSEDVSAEKINDIIKVAIKEALNNDVIKVSTEEAEAMTEELANALVNQRIKADNILIDDSKNADVKLFEIFNLYKEDLQKLPKVFYAMLNWKNCHLAELRQNGCISLVPDYIKK